MGRPEIEASHYLVDAKTESIMRETVLNGLVFVGAESYTLELRGTLLAARPLGSAVCYTDYSGTNLVTRL